MTNFLLTNFGSAVLEEPISSSALSLRISAAAAALLPQPEAGQAFAITLWDGVYFEILYCTDNPLTGTLTVSRGEEGTTAQTWLAGSQVRHALTAETIPNLLQLGFISGNMASTLEAQLGALVTKLMSPLRTTEHFNARTTAFTRDLLFGANAEEVRSALGWESQTYSGTGLETTYTLPSAS